MSLYKQHSIQKSHRYLRKTVRFSLILIILLSQNNYSFSSDTLAVKKSTNRLSKKVDKGNNIDCTPKYRKRARRFIKRLNTSEVEFYLKEGTVSVKFWILQKCFDDSLKIDSEKEEIIRGFSNNIIFTCGYSSAEHFFDYVLFYFRNQKNSNLELYKLFLELGGKLPEVE